MKKYDIHVTFTIMAKDEQKADEEVINFLKLSGRAVGCPNLIDWELTEFIPTEELAKACCC